MKRLKGLNTDTSPENQPAGTYRHLENGMLSRDFGSVVNEEGFLSVASLPAGYYLLGKLELSDGRVVLYSTNNASSEIGTFNGTQYQTVLNSSLLNFNWDYPIDLTFKENELGEFIVYWTDNLNPPRKINIDNVPSVTASNLYTLNVFPSIKSIPEFTLQSVNDTGGSLKTGSYYIGVSYINEDNVESNTFLLSNEICIYDESQNSEFDQIDGSEPNITTSKSITFLLSNLDTSYKYLNLYLIPKYGDEVRNPLVIEYLSFTESISYTVTGNETFVEKSLFEFQVDYASYNKAKTLDIVDDNLYMGNLETDLVDIGYQPFANNIEVHCVTDTCSINNFNNSYKDPIFIHNKKGFNPGEVYAFYVSFILKNGKETPAYHIPGRKDIKQPGDITVESNAPFGTNTYATSTIGIDIGSANTTGVLSFEFIDHNGNTSTFDVNVTNGDTPVQVSDAIITAFSDLNFTLDYAGGELNVRATNYGSFFNGAHLNCIGNYSYIKSGLENRATNNTQGGTTDTDDVSDTFTIDGSNIVVTFPAGSTQSVIATAIFNAFDLNTAYTVIIEGFKISAEESAFNPSISVNLSGTAYSENNSIDELSAIPNTDPEYNRLKAITGDVEPLQYQFKSNLVNGMEYWENQTETYPDNSNFTVKGVDASGNPTDEGTIVGENVRHHRFPRADNHPFFSGGNLQTEALNGTILGVQLKNFKVPTSIRNEVAGWKFYYAKPDTNNKLIVSQGCTVPVDVIGDLEKFRKEVDPTINQDNAYVYGVYDFHALKNKIDIGSVTHIEIVARLSSETYTFDTNEVIRQTWRNNTFPSLEKYIKVNGKAYVPNNIDNVAIANNGFSRSIYDNSYAPSHILIELDDVMPYTDDGFFNGDGGVYGFYYINLHSLKTDVYQNFYLQELEWTGHYSFDIDRLYPPVGSPPLVASQTNELFGGDTFLGRVAFKHTDGSRRMLIDYIALSQSNVNLRHAGDRVIDVYYPKSSEDDAMSPSVQGFDEFSTPDEVDNFIGYSNNYSSDNTIKPIDGFDYLREQDYKFPHRIIRNTGNSEGFVDNFQRFLPDDFIEIGAYKGPVTKITGMSNVLYIHSTRTLYRTYGKEEIAIGDDRAFIGTGDLFARKPQELFDIEGGYGGLTDIRHSIYCERGYFFIDTIQGKVFKLGESLIPISDNGLRDYLFENRIIEPISQNQYLNFLNGWRIGYDNLYKRLFVSKVNYELEEPLGFTTNTYDLIDGDFRVNGVSSNIYDHVTNKGFTLTFIPDMQAWEGFHSYVGDVFSTDQPFMIDDMGDILKMNGGVVGDFVNQSGLFSYGIAQPFGKQATVDSFIVDAIFRELGVYSQDTFNTVQFKNSYQDTGELTVVLYPSVNSNSRWIRNEFRFNQIFDKLEAGQTWIDREQLKDTYIEATITYTGNKNVYLNNIKFIAHE